MPGSHDNDDKPDLGVPVVHVKDAAGDVDITGETAGEAAGDTAGEAETGPLQLEPQVAYDNLA